MNGHKVIGIIVAAWQEYDRYCTSLGEEPTFQGFMVMLEKYIDAHPEGKV